MRNFYATGYTLDHFLCDGVKVVKRFPTHFRYFPSQVPPGSRVGEFRLSNYNSLILHCKSMERNVCSNWSIEVPKIAWFIFKYVFLSFLLLETKEVVMNLRNQKATIKWLTQRNDSCTNLRCKEATLESPSEIYRSNPLGVISLEGSVDKLKLIVICKQRNYSICLRKNVSFVN